MTRGHCRADRGRQLAEHGMKQNTDELAQARAVLGTLTFFSSERPHDIGISRLGGLTNLVFKVDCSGDSYVLRLPGKGTSDYIDRNYEAVAAHEAARVNVGPEVICSDPDSGLMVTQWLRAATMTPQLFRWTPGAARRAGEVLRRLHDSDAKFDFKFDLFGMLDEYARVLTSHRAELPQGLPDTLKLANELRDTLAKQPSRLVACHCDLLPENFLDTGTRMYLVDWEFSGMNDPYWDLADASVECAFTPKEEQAMLAGYFGGEARPADIGRMVIYKALCDLLWTLWGLIQHASNNPADDFRSYANRRFARCQSIISNPDFALHVLAGMRG